MKANQRTSRQGQVKKKANPFGRLGARSKTFQSYYETTVEKTGENGIKTIALIKKNCLKKEGLKKEKVSKRHRRGWIASPCAATLNRRRRICRRLAVGLTTRLSWQHKKSWTKSTPDGFGLLPLYCSLLRVGKS